MDGSNWRWDSNGSPGNGPIPPPRPTPESGPSAWVILAVAAFLVGAGYVLIQQLAEMTRIQNCAIQGRTNCVMIDTSHRTASGPRWPFRN